MPTSNHNKAFVAKHWTAAILTDLGFKVEISSRASLLAITKGKRTLTVRTKACYDEQGVPFNGFQIGDSDFVILVDLRQEAMRAQAWVVPMQVVYAEMERAYEVLGSARLNQRSFYWQNDSKPHYGYERKLRPYKGAHGSFFTSPRRATPPPSRKLPKALFGRKSLPAQPRHSLRLGSRSVSAFSNWESWASEGRPKHRLAWPRSRSAGRARRGAAGSRAPAP